MVNTNANTYAALAPRLHAAGYAVLPLDSKAPKVPKWSELAITQQQVEQWALRNPRPTSVCAAIRH